MRFCLVLSFVLAALAAPALAQVVPPADSPPADPLPPPEPDPPPPPPPRPIPVEPTPIAPAIENEPEEAAPPPSRRPEAFSIGIGAGYELPADLQVPNRTSVRFRLPSGLTFEPIFGLQRTGTSTEVGDIDVSSSTFALAIAGDARFPLRVHDRADFILIGGAGIGFSTTDPDGDDNDSSTTLFDIHWGVGLEFWLTHHWSLSFNATNPLLAYLVEVEDTGPADPETTQTTSQFGLVFAPEVAFMIHLYL